MRLADALHFSGDGTRRLALALGVAVFTLIAVTMAGGSRALATVTAGAAMGLLLVGARFHAAAVARALELGRQLASYDAATDLPSPDYSDHFVASEFAAAQRGRPITIALFHFDRFEDFTRAHGAAAADHAVREFGSILKGLTRRMNHSARYGWRLDAFLSVLSEADEAAAMVFIERVRTAVAESGRRAPMPTLSIGLAEFRPGFTTPEQFVEAAELALGEARADGGNCVRYARSGDTACLTRPLVQGRWSSDAGPGRPSTRSRREAGLSRPA